MTRIYSLTGPGETRYGAAPRVRDWLKFVCDLVIITALAVFFGSGYTPPGVCGDVIRHNQSADIDASPFFFGDVENMNELIEGAERLWHPSPNPTTVDSTIPNTEAYQEEF